MDLGLVDWWWVLLFGLIVLLAIGAGWFVGSARRGGRLRLLFHSPGTERGVDLFLRGLFVPDHEYFTRAPDYPATAGAGFTVHKCPGIAEALSGADVAAALELQGLLARAGVPVTFDLHTIETTRHGWQRDGFMVGPHYKALATLDGCEPRLIAYRNPGAFRSLVTRDVFEAGPVTDYGLVYKGRHPVTRRWFWVLMGLSDPATRLTARYLSEHAELLATLVGRGPFAAVVAIEGDRATLRSLMPRPAWWRRLLYRKTRDALMPPPGGPPARTGTSGERRAVARPRAEVRS